jgi:hypothetical protein
MEHRHAELFPTQWGLSSPFPFFTLPFSAQKKNRKVRKKIKKKSEKYKT